MLTRLLRRDNRKGVMRCEKERTFVENEGEDSSV
jgi:hypothetical protein